MTAAHLRAGLHLIYLVVPLVRLGCTERSGCACSDCEWPSLKPCGSGAVVSDMFKKLNRDRPRLLGELGDLSYARVSSSEFKYGGGTEIFGEAEPADYIYQIVEGAVRSHKLLSDGRRQIGAFHLPGDILASRMAISIVSQPKLSSTPRFALLNGKAWNAWPQPTLRWP